MIPRGLRNNNPGNIRRSGNNWKGKLPAGGDPEFEVFVDMAHGYRALLINLRTYVNRYRCDTIRKIITRWAPPTENNTGGYILQVSRLTGMQPDEEVKATKETLTAIAGAISYVENGVPAKREDVEAGWEII